jgi:flagellar motor switch protein FliN/FliY
VSDRDLGPPERITAFAQQFFDGAGPVLTTMMNRAIEVTMVGVDDVTPAQLLREVPLPWVLIEASYARGLAGGHWLIVGRPGALVVGQVLTGDEDAEALDLTPAHEEAIRETADQLLSAAASSLAPLIGRSLSFAPAAVTQIDDPAAVPPELSSQFGRIWLIRAEATGPDDFRADFTLTVSTDLASEIATVASAAGASGSESGQLLNAPAGIDLILDVALPVAVELGRARMQIQDILKLAPGSIIELDKSAGDPVEILINDRPIARGEVVVVDENFGVRLTSIVTAAERIKSLR